MDRLKKFLTEKKVNRNFKRAGAGYRLGDSSAAPIPARPSSVDQQQTSQIPTAERIASADIAAQAAYKRMNYGVTQQESLTQRNIRLRALKELEQEKKEREKCVSADLNTGNSRHHEIEEREFEHSSAISGVYYTCDLLGDEKLTKNEIRQKVEEFLKTQLADDPLVASTLMIFSLNGPDKRQNASATLQKYLTNLIENPDEEKFRRIRMSNKALQERVLSTKGGREFLLACGFEEKDLNNNGQQERFLEIPDNKAVDTQSLIQALEMLQTSQAVPLKLSRNAAVYKLEPNQVITNPRLPRDFFDLDATEIKKEQQQREADVERLTTLRTREMRERDDVMCNYRYKYTLIRIRFPNRFLLQEHDGSKVPLEKPSLNDLLIRMVGTSGTGMSSAGDSNCNVALRRKQFSEEGTFGCYESFEAVRSFVKQHLANVEPLLFVLKDPVSGKAIRDDAKTLNELSLLPAAVLHFEWDPDMLSELVRLGQPISYLDQRFTENAEQFTA